MPNDTLCNYCGNLYDHKAGTGHKRGCKMAGKRNVQTRTKKLHDGTTVRLTTFEKKRKKG